MPARGWRRLAVIGLAASLASTLVQPVVAPAQLGRVRAADPPAFLAEGEGSTTVPAAAASLPTGFTDEAVFTGLDQPTVVRFAPDGRVFVAEKRGVVKVFDSLTDPTPDTFADFQADVMDYWDRGLLGLALDPDFASNHYVYVLYSRDALPGGSSPKWNDSCADATGNGCVISGRLVRYTASGNTGGSAKVLITDWCQQYPSHSVGTLQFGPDGYLYAGAGDGASFTYSDYGQKGSPDLNPCGDPPSGVGGTQTPPTAEGGALRSQDIRSSADPATLDGAIIRVNPADGVAAPGNPGAASADANVKRIIAYGMRNPFRFTFRPGTSELWVGDVGYSTWEEIDRITNITTSTHNLGWPCYEGNAADTYYGSTALNLCTSLSSSAVTFPYFTYNHAAKVVADEACPTGSSAIAGLAFYSGTGTYPTSYDGGLFFADNARDCIWFAPAQSDGTPNMGQVQTFVANASNPVDLEIGPDGNLYYADFGGTIRRIRYAQHAPTANATANPTAGLAPLHVDFSGTGSTDPDGDTLTYAWDLDGDGQYDDATGATTSWTYVSAGTYHPALRVNDSNGGTDTDTLTVTAGNSPPVPTITSPADGSTWSVGQQIAFHGTATDAQDGSLTAPAFSWELIIHHCPSNCHIHSIQTWDGKKGASFIAPDHEYPSYLELKLTVTDSGGLSASTSIQLDPLTADLSVASSPTGLQLSAFTTTQPAPFSVTLIQGGSTTVSAPKRQVVGGREYRFISWSDGGAASHEVVAPAGGISLTATYRRVVDRIADGNRYRTAVAISADAFTPGVPAVYLGADDSPLSAAAAAAAALAGGPFLLTPSGSLPNVVADELARLDPDRVVLVGGPGVISGTVRAQVSRLLP